MTQPTIWAALAIAFVTVAVAERRLDRTHRRILADAGAREAVPVLARAYYALSSLVVPAALFEQLWTARDVSRDALALGLLLVGLGVGLRLWAIRSLGVLWTMRCLVPAEARRLNLGPYRYINHPEYLSRMIEALGVGLALGAWLTAAAYLPAAALLAAALARAEGRELAAARGVDIPEPVE